MRLLRIQPEADFEPRTMTQKTASRLPPANDKDPIVAEIFARLRAQGRTTLHLHQTLAHAPELLQAVLALAETLRQGCVTPRRLRELVILRTAQLESSAYELAQHLPMARASGIGGDEIAALDHWRDSSCFDERERAGLAYAETIAGNGAADAAELDRLFTPREIVELTLTAAFYLMTARTIRALEIRLE